MRIKRQVSRSGFALWAIFYAVAILYSSTVVGPNGFNFVAISLEDAWTKFLQTHYWVLGSDQRADWMANLLMLVPMGFLTTGAVRPRNRVSLISSFCALTLCVAFILVVKFIQLFFPGRTVSLNYITAQSVGALIGVTAYSTLFQRVIAKWHSVDARRFAVFCLTVYALFYFIFMLLPLNFIFSVDEIRWRLTGLPQILWSLPGEGRSTPIRIALILANLVAAIPLGLVLAIKVPNRSMLWYATVCVGAIAAVTGLKIFIMSATPHLAAIAYDSIGILLGVGLALSFGPRQAVTLRTALLRSLPLLVPLYIVVVLEMNNLISREWRTQSEAFNALDIRGLIPFWHWYIVSKAQAAQSQAAHAIMFAPIGFMLALRNHAGRGSTWLAAGLALLFSVLIELGRWFRPGLQPDFYEAVTAVVAAGLTVPLMRFVWNLLGATPGKEGVGRLHNIVASGQYEHDSA